jgi:hypothetical protein
MIDASYNLYFRVMKISFLVSLAIMGDRTCCSLISGNLVKIDKGAWNRQQFEIACSRAGLFIFVHCAIQCQKQ